MCTTCIWPPCKEGRGYQSFIPIFPTTIWPPGLFGEIAEINAYQEHPIMGRGQGLMQETEREG